MKKILHFAAALMIWSGVWAQQSDLPSDFRQHNVQGLNSSLFTPVYALNKRNVHNLDFWSRWQWQTIDGDPTSLFVDYTYKLDDKNAVGAGFLQHNTGIFLQTGGILNMAKAFKLSEDVSLAVGLNVIGFQQKLAQELYLPDDGVILDEQLVEDEFILQFAPGLQLSIDDFHIGATSENLFVTANDSDSRDRIYTFHADYHIPLNLFGEGASLAQPYLYYKKIPYLDNQVGGGVYLQLPSFWAQTGYNSFYGPNIGVGATLFQKFTVGAIMEFATRSELKDEDPTMELVASLSLGRPKSREKVEEPEPDMELVKAEQDRKRDSIANVRAAEALAAAQRLKEQRQRDSIAVAQKRLALEQRRLDSLQAVAAAKEKPQPKTKGRYEEVSSLGGLAPGYYIIANVFGTKKYYEMFMKDLKKRGLDPKSFYRDINKYNYVYLERYDTLQAAEKARDSQFFGRYKDNKVWIFRVIGE